MQLIEIRLVAAYMTHEDLLNLGKRKSFIMSEHAQVMVSRREEFANISESDFKAITDAMNEQLFENKLDSLIDETEDELNRRMDLLDLDEITFKLEQPIHLGQFFSKKDAYGNGTIMTGAVNGYVKQEVVGGALVRVKNKIIYIYFSNEYKNTDSIKEVRIILEKWADNILKVNEVN
ncbi:hypothetical protein NRK67_12300 [Fusobacteria bacterium ZRK30]|nr:hypothetical protein NRK67_12300 [Fusobacteria bacterium ZRK30]